MTTVKKFWFIPFSIILVAIFFYKTILHGYLPFPGDLLVAEYKPWSSYSYLGYNPGSYPNKAQYFDTLRQLYPWKTFVIDEFKKGQVPLWNPHNFSGSPILGNFQSAVLYPFTLFYILFPQHIAWTLLVILQPLLTFIFTYLYCQKLKLSRLGSLFASVSFSFSSFMTVWLEYNSVGQVVLWLPLILCAIENLRQGPKRFWMFVLVAALSFSLLAGHPQVFTYLLIFSLAYAFYRIKQRSLRIMVSLLVFLALGICGAQLLPGIELIVNAARSPLVYTDIIHKVLIQPWQLIMLVIPDFFGNPATRNYWLQDTYVGKVLSIGIVPLFFFLAALRARFDSKKFYLGTLVIVLLLTTANPLTQTLYRLNIPLLTGSSPTLMTFLFQFSLAILCGFGIDSFRKEKHTLKKLTMRTTQVVLFFIALWLIATKTSVFIHNDFARNLALARRSLLYEGILSAITIGGFAVVISKRKLMTLVLVILLVVHITDLFYAFGKFNPFSPKEFTYPPTPVIDFVKSQTNVNRFWGLGSGRIEANFATQLSLYSPDGYDPLYPRWYGEFIQSTKDGKIHTDFTQSTRSDATVAPSSSDDFSTNFYRLRVLNLLGVRYILDRNENLATAQTFPPALFSLTYNQDGWKVLDNKLVMPRAFLVSDYRVYGSKEEFEKIFFDQRFDPTSTVLLKESPSMQLVHDDVKGNATIVSYDSSRVIVKTRAAGERLLFLSDVFYPGWKAFIDNREVSILRADWAFRTVSVPAGEHDVRFVYDPISWKIGLLISIMSILVTAIIISKPQETK